MVVRERVPTVERDSMALLLIRVLRMRRQRLEARVCSRVMLELLALRLRRRAVD